MVIGKRENMGIVEKAAVLEMLESNLKLSGDNGVLKERALRTQAEHDLEISRQQKRMLELLSESYAVSARGLLGKMNSNSLIILRVDDLLQCKYLLSEYWRMGTLTTKYPQVSSRHAQWVRYLSDKTSTGPDLHRCLAADNPYLHNAASAATFLEGMFSSLSGNHHHSTAMDIQDGKSVVIPLSMPAAQRKALVCLCKHAWPYPVPFDLVDTTASLSDNKDIA